MFKTEILTAIFVLVNIEIGRCSILSTPSNMIVVVGQWMEMECRTSNGSIVREWMRILGKRTEKLFHNWETAPIEINPQFPRFGVDVDASGSGLLYSNSTELEDAGIYICTVEDNSKLLQYSAHLIVLESTPVCEMNLTVDENALLTNLWVQCSVRFRGGWGPSVEWKHHDGDRVTGGNGKVLKDGVRTVIVPNSTITSTLTTALESRKDLYFISYKISFSRPNGSISVNATNTPSYQYTCFENFGVEFSEGLQSTDFTKWTEASTMKIPTIPSSSDNISVPENGKYSLLLWVVASLATIIAVMAITAIICFFRLRSNKAESRLKVTSGSESHENVESLQYGDILPYAISGHYDTIEELDIADEPSTESPIIFLPKRTGLLLPTPEYSGLTTVAQIVPPSVYCRMNPYESVEEDSGSGKELSVLTNVSGREESEAYLDKGKLQCKDHEVIVHKVDSDIYLTPIDDTVDTRSVDVNPSYLELSE